MPVLLKKQREQRVGKRRIVSFALIGLAVMISSLAFSTTSVSSKPEIKTLGKSQPAIRLLGNNPTPNPGPTSGPACASRVIVLLDRSYSIINVAQSNGRPDREYVKQLKSALLDFMTVIGTRAASVPNGKAEVLIDAFATTGTWQNGMAPGQNFFDWAAGLNIADPTNRFYQALNVGVDPSGVDGIWYSDTDNYTYNPFLPSTAYKGYAANANLPSDTYGATNYHQAFADAASMIDFWTNPGDAGDDDFDMVLMITDGFPTANSGNNHTVDPGEAGIQGPFVNPDMADLLYAAYGVNKLRSGQSFTNSSVVRPPVPVVGIIAGGATADPNAQDYMNSVFGMNNWYSASNFSTDLGDRIADATAGLGCTGGRPVKTNVSSGISISTTANSPDDLASTPGIYEIKEGGSATVTVTVENTGDADLDQVAVTITGQPDRFIGSLSAHRTYSFTYTKTLPVGAPLNSDDHLVVTSRALYDPATQNLVGPTNPSSPDDITFGAIRIPFPT